jgi:hypothetical protein
VVLVKPPEVDFLGPAAPLLTVEDARALLERIRHAAQERDDELAHCLRDELWLGVLQQVTAERPAKRLRALARIALETETIAFGRWYA